MTIAPRQQHAYRTPRLIGIMAVVVLLNTFFFRMITFAQEQTAPIDALRVIDTHEIDLVAGTSFSSAVLSPDGGRFIYFNRGDLCIYTLQGVSERCTEFASYTRLHGPIAPDTLYWSTDSKWVTFTTNALQLFLDSDIWVLNAATGVLTNITDDGMSDIGLFSDQPGSNVDLWPRWLPDGRIIFLRYSVNQGEVAPPSLYAIPPEGGEPQLLGILPRDDDDPDFALTHISPSPDGTQVVYSIGRFAPNSAGLWISDIDGGNARRLALVDPALLEQYQQFGLLTNASFSPVGDYLLVVGELFRPPLRPDESPLRYIQAESSDSIGQLVDEERPVVLAGWSPDGASPDGAALAYVVRSLDEPEQSGLYLAAGPGEPGRLVLAGEFVGPTAYQSTILWASNNTILLTRREDQKLFVVILGE